MYSHLDKTCKVVANIEKINDNGLENYAICGFMDKIYLIGGSNDFISDLCIEFDTNDFSWKHKSKMLERRIDSAACVFEEQIIVSGGMHFTGDDFVNFVNFYEHDNHQTLNTVEAYDPTDDTWTKFSTMHYSRCCHKSVVVKNKLFVISGGTNINEIYDSTSKKFAILRPSMDLYDLRENYPIAIFKVSHKLFFYFTGSPSIFCFDTKKGEWYKKPGKITKHLYFFSAIQVPRL